MSASISPVIKPSKKGTDVRRSRRYLSRIRCSAGAENSSGAKGTPQGSHGHPPSVFHQTAIPPADRICFGELGHGRRGHRVDRGMVEGLAAVAATTPVDAQVRARSRV